MTGTSSSPTPTARTKCRDHGRQRDGRVKYGTASWVYGEELGQRTAMWWSPEAGSSPTTASTRARCRTSTWRWTRRKLQTALDVEAYPKAGRAQSGRRPVRLRLAPPGSRTRIDVRDGKPFDERRRSGTTSTTSSGRPMAARSRSTAPTAARTCWSWRRAARRRARAVWSSTRNGRPAGSTTSRAHAVPAGRQALHLGVASATAATNYYLYDLDRQAHPPAHDGATFEVGRHRARGRGTKPGSF